MSFAAGQQVPSIPPAPVRRLKWLSFAVLGLAVLGFALSLLVSMSDVEHVFSFLGLIAPIACVALAFAVERGTSGARIALIVIPILGLVSVVRGISVLSVSTRFLPQLPLSYQVSVVGRLLLVCAAAAIYVIMLVQANNIHTVLWCKPRPAGQSVLGQPSPPQPYPPQYGQPQYGQPQYGQPQYGQPQYGQPQYGQPQYGQPQYGQPQYGQPQYDQVQQGHAPDGHAPYGQPVPHQQAGMGNFPTQ